jgi:hypothetical protein
LYRSRAFRGRGLLEEPDHALPDCSPGESDALEHVLVDVEANAVTGIIDWTDAAIADPARDLALIYRDFGGYRWQTGNTNDLLVSRRVTVARRA